MRLSLTDVNALEYERVTPVRVGRSDGNGQCNLLGWISLPPPIPYDCDLAFMKCNVALKSIDFIRMDAYQSRLEKILQ